MSGTGLILRLVGQAERRRLVAWAVTILGSLALTAVSVGRLYDTPDKIRSYGQAVVGNALVAINGRVEGIGSLGGIIADEFGFLASFLMPLVGIALIASMTRAEEESGRLEAVLCGRIDRRAPVVAALVVVLGEVMVVVVGFVVSLVAVGIDAGPAVLYSLSLGMVSLVFAAFAAVAAQVVLHSRGVYATGFVVVGVSYVLRGVGDVTGTFWVWLSPLGWLEKAAAFAHDPRWWVLLIPLAVTVGLGGLAVVLAGRRDLGAALHRPGPGAESGSGWIVRPLGLAVHRQQGGFLAWLTGSLALAAVMGALARELVHAVVGNPSLTRAMGITRGDAADGVLAMTQVYLALIASGYLVQSVGTLRHEELAGRLEPMLGGSVARSRWLGAQLAATLGGLAVVVVGSALVLGATTALSTGGSGYLPTLFEAGLAYVPAELVIAGVAFLLYGLVPQAFALAWAAFGAVTFIGLLGSGLQLPPWVLDLSPLTWIGNPPRGHVDASSVAGLLVVAPGLLAAAFGAFRHRPVPEG
jgi:ABC-2 type transport system permease protein